MTTVPADTSTPTSRRRASMLIDNVTWYFRFRMALDRLIRYAVAVGGVSIIIAITGIFLFLLIEVLPIFTPASIEVRGHYRVPGAEQAHTLHLAVEEQNEVALRVSDNGELTFFNTRSGQVIQQVWLKLPNHAHIVSFANANAKQATFALGLDSGEVLLVRHEYESTYVDNTRTITPRVEYPYGAKPIVIDPQGETLRRLAMQEGDDGITVVAATEDERLLLVSITKQKSFLSEDVSYERNTVTLPYPSAEVTHLLINKDQQQLYIASRGGNLSFYDIRNKAQPKLLQHLAVTRAGANLTALASLTGGISILVGASDGNLSQWSILRDENNNEQWVKFRDFEPLHKAIVQIVPELNRKGFVAIDEGGGLGIYHTTAQRTLLQRNVSALPLRRIGLSPRANALAVLDDRGTLDFWLIHNPHPEISWSALWNKVWYESYPEPKYQWQSSSASDDFEPKFSLTPLSFGTLKAAFYAILIAVPLSIMAAIFTAQFMSPRMRRSVKPSIEIMAALPTVILGFLAGLWLAPMMEKNLLAILLLFIALPIGIVMTSYLWHRLPAGLRFRVPEGWEAAILIPTVVMIGWAVFMLGPYLEQGLFHGNLVEWLGNPNKGGWLQGWTIDYDQRNALVVGIAMGVAVVPIIFSIAEDALFAVPKHLIHGSLALGATPWQTLVRVVLLTASPGIFSAVMIGLGRAVGETMIVLMATGNTPVMDLSAFHGMRTLSANIAVEMPEAEVASSHYRVLFLAAMVLFMFTFIVNTLAEIIRQHLRKKYSSL
ncbi:MAG: ABC transporter permease subunit [Gammaproteobacteria bacterium]|nr:ABC transporter permease subunit [Gammaproteobacteria bacterium]